MSNLAGTIDLVSAEVVLTDFIAAMVTCVFAEGSTARGCLATFESTSVNVSRSEGATVATESFMLPEEVSQPVMVVIAEILSDGSVGTITIQPVLSVITTTTAGKV